MHLTIVYYLEMVLTRSTMGRPAILGELYSAHADIFIPGFSLWSHEDIEKHKQVVWNPHSRTHFSVDSSRENNFDKLDTFYILL